MGGVSTFLKIRGQDKAEDAARKAAKIQAGAADRATDLQRDIFEQTRENLDPFITGGQESFELHK